MDLIAEADLGELAPENRESRLASALYLTYLTLLFTVSASPRCDRLKR